MSAILREKFENYRSIEIGIGAAVGLYCGFVSVAARPRYNGKVCQTVLLLVRQS